jgi:hypothetical protein
MNIYNVWLIQFQLEIMREYLNLTMDALRHYEDKMETAWSQETMQKMVDNDDEEMLLQYEEYIDRFAGLLGHVPRRIHTSFIVSWFSFIEDELLSLCESLNLSINIGVNDRTNFGSGIRRAYEFLAKSADYKINDNHWQELTLINKMRNQIVHRNGKFISYEEKPSDDDNVIFVSFSDKERDTEHELYSEIDKQLFRYLREKNLLHFYGTLFIYPSVEYCYYLLDFADEFFSRIFNDFGLI